MFVYRLSICSMIRWALVGTLIVSSMWIRFVMFLINIRSDLVHVCLQEAVNIGGRCVGGAIGA